MNISTITTYLLFTVAVHSYENQICAQRLSCTYCYDTPFDQQPEQTMEISTIITCLLFTVPLHYSEDETLADTSYCTPYCATPGNQQPKQSCKEAPPLIIIFLQ